MATQPRDARTEAPSGIDARAAPTPPAVVSASPAPPPSAVVEALVASTGPASNASAPTTPPGPAAAPVLPVALSAPAAPDGAAPASMSVASIAVRAEAGTTRVELVLHPASLGRVQLTVERAGDDAPRITIAAEKPATLALLAKDAPTLAHVLDQAGIPREGRGIAFQPATPSAAIAHEAESVAAPAASGAATSAHNQPDPGTQRHQTPLEPTTRSDGSSAPLSPDAGGRDAARQGGGGEGSRGGVPAGVDATIDESAHAGADARGDPAPVRPASRGIDFTA